MRIRGFLIPSDSPTILIGRGTTEKAQNSMYKLRNKAVFIKEHVIQYMSYARLPDAKDLR